MRTEIFAVLLCTLPVYGGNIYSTGFEAFTTGNVNGQDGWTVPGNSPTLGIVTTLPAGSPSELGTQGLRLYQTSDAGLFGVANGLVSPWIDPAGESGATPSAAENSFHAEFWYRTPDQWSGGVGSGIVGLNPASSVGGRYAWFGPVVAEIGAAGVTQVDFMIDDVVVYPEVLNSTWYRLVYELSLNDGTNGTEPNDVFSVSVYNPASNLLGYGTASTWEMPWRSGSYGGPAQPRSIQGLDFLRRWGPVATDLGFIDNLTISSGNTIPDPVPEPATWVMIGLSLLAVGGIGRHRRNCSCQTTSAFPK